MSSPNEGSCVHGISFSARLEVMDYQVIFPEDGILIDLPLHFRTHWSRIPARERADGAPLSKTRRIEADHCANTQLNLPEISVYCSYSIALDS